MPWKMQKKGAQYAVVEKGTGKEVGRHPTPAAAQAQVSALYANHETKGQPKFKKSKSHRANMIRSAASRRASKVKKEDTKGY